MVKTYDLQNTSTGYEAYMEMVESLDIHGKPDGQGDWVRTVNYDALAAELSELKPRERLLYDEFSKSRDRTRELEAALRELVRLKDLKTDAEAINTSGSWEAKHKQDAMRADYENAKPLAWDAARRALTPLETACDAECRCGHPKAAHVASTFTNCDHCSCIDYEPDRGAK